ncbi:MAG: methylmalonyl-CoA mutase [candidate division Zixibacteria bacterium]|nr:methylmalonyl-CoA mutase [candidate division Zixibacteria bacterium]
MNNKKFLRPEDRREFDYARDLGDPGQYPYTRGVYPAMYTERLWTMRQYAGYATAAESNQRYRYLLAQGQTGLSVAFDLPTQIGYDSDDPMAVGEVGRTGVAIDTLADFETLFDGIPLDRVSTSMTINATAAILLCMYIAVAKKQGVAPVQITGTVQNDILKEFIARGTYIYPPQPSLRLVTDIFAYAGNHLPRYNTISISGYHIREAGATAIQEVAFTLANGIEYVKQALAAELNVDDFAPRLSFFFCAQQNLLEEVAKFRAARRLWARIMRERFGARDPRSLMLRFHTQTAGVSLTAQQPEVNTVRTTLEALAAVLGGTQSLHTNAHDEALALPTAASAQLALRIQQVIGYEIGISEAVDPLAGSYVVEAKTDEIEHGANEYLTKIDRIGGALRAIEEGFFQREIQRSAYEFQLEVEARKRTIVGVNKFKTDDRVQVPLQKISEQSREEQIARLKHVKAERDNLCVTAALTRLEQAATTTENLMPLILDCVEAYASVGEISNTLRRAWGEYKETVVV